MTLIIVSVIFIVVVGYCLFAGNRGELRGERGTGRNSQARDGGGEW